MLAVGEDLDAGVCKIAQERERMRSNKRYRQVNSNSVSHGVKTRCAGYENLDALAGRGLAPDSLKEQLGILGAADRTLSRHRVPEKTLEASSSAGQILRRRHDSGWLMVCRKKHALGHARRGESD